MTDEQAVTWLKAASVLTIVVGLVAALGAANATDGPWLWLFDLLDWPVDGDPGGFDDRERQLNAILGGVMVGWAVLLLLIVTKQFSRGNHELALPMIGSVLAWFVVDSTGSVVAGLVGNVVLNASFVALFLPPLVHLHRAQ